VAAVTLSVSVAVRPAPDSPFVVDVAFEAPPGITILFGPSGAGKTTLLSTIAGLLGAERGRIAVGGEVWFDSEVGVDRPAHRRSVGLVFQSLALFPHLTALDNVAYGLPRALDREERRAQARRLLSRMRVEAVADRLPATFSGGEGQRVALARAVAAQPRVLLLDEAFSAMDEPLRRDLQADVRAYVAEARIPAIQITHQRDEARALGDRVVVVEAGRVRAQGSISLLDS
jgi:molybdate transport system ATP-binding protein